MNGPARYRIRIRGVLSTVWAERLGGMSCSSASGTDGEPETQLEGYLQDQAALSGILNTLYELQLPVLLVEYLDRNRCQPLQGRTIMGENTTTEKEPTPDYNTPIPDKLITPDLVKTRLGDLNFDDGRPDGDTVDILYDNLDFMRGVDTFLNFVPAASIEAIRLGNAELGASQCNQVVVLDDLLDSNPLFLTGNTDTVYASAILDLEKDGPTVVEIPPGAGPGTVNDAYFRFVVDMGAPGLDRGKGGKYLILPPGDDAGLPEGYAVPGGYFIVKSRTYVNWLILRGFLVDGEPDVSSQMWRNGLKIYPLTQAGNPPEMEFFNGSTEVFNTIHANNYEFFEELHTVIDREPADFVEPQLLGIAAAIGIQKGKDFAPDDRLKTILEDAIEVGNATARAIWLKPRDAEAYLYDKESWYTGFVGGDYRWFVENGEGARNMDARTLFFYSATVNTPAMAAKMVGAGSQYAYCAVDVDGQYLDGSKTYELHLPPEVPAKDFWSVVVYDPQTRSELQTSQPFPSKNDKRDDLEPNDDGSVTLYYGPDEPEDKDIRKNWTETVPGKGWFVLLRLYGPLEPWFDKSWQPGEFKLVK